MRSRCVRVAVDRLVLVPGRLGERRLELLSHPHARTAGGLGEHEPSRPVPTGRPGARMARRRTSRTRARSTAGRREGRCGCDAGRRAKHLALRDRVAGAQVVGMVGVALDLDRTGVVALDEHALADAAPLEAGGVVDRLAGDPLLPVVRRARCAVSGMRRHAASRDPASAKEAPMTLMNCRRSSPSRRSAFGRELAMHPGPEVLGLLQVVEAAPVAARRTPRPGLAGWHRVLSAPGVPVGRRSDSAMACRAVFRGVDVVEVLERLRSSRVISTRWSQARLVTWSTGRRLSSGLRWHSRHQPMDSGSCRCTTSIWSMRPWHSTQPTPRFTCAEWSKYE